MALKPVHDWMLPSDYQSPGGIVQINYHDNTSFYSYDAVQDSLKWGTAVARWKPKGSPGTPPELLVWPFPPEDDLPF